MNIPFNKPPVTGVEAEYVAEAIKSQKLCGDGDFTKRCQSWFEKRLGCKRALLTPNCTQALEMAALLMDIQEGDEVIMPSYTFVSTANAFVMRGAKIVFVDINPDTMNIDERLIEEAITTKTKAIVPVHYAGVACEMETIMAIANKNNLFVVEDAAQGMLANYKGKPLGSFGHFSAFSFHETKNYTSGGEGGLLVINDQKYVKRAEIIREKGTNRSLFFRGMVDKYSWVDVGSSFLPSELQAAYLYAQITQAELINTNRLSTWGLYFTELSSMNKGYFEIQSIPVHREHNAHMFFIKLPSIEKRQELIDYLSANNVQSAFHYVPLHSSKAGLEFGQFSGVDKHTTLESEKLLRLPMFYGIERNEVLTVTRLIKSFFN